MLIEYCSPMHDQQRKQRKSKLESGIELEFGTELGPKSTLWLVIITNWNQLASLLNKINCTWIEDSKIDWKIRLMPVCEHSFK